ncbi:hypothetical protein [Ornatilinea apprima]|uniref:hypothetical protein n=1 Tax=Ornatilinea apprima TaxID=1134406 RepID=UPI0009465418|nr:hypothetical protein [Ornatilinea apprima]
MSEITIFTAPKPFTNPHIALIQRNAMESWTHLGPEVEVLVIGDEEGIAEACAELKVRHLPDVERNSSGTPLVSSIFEMARKASSSPVLVYVNADVIFFPQMVESIKAVARQEKNFLLVGQRWDLDLRESIDFSGNWSEWLNQEIASRGRLHPRGGSDYFVYPRDCFSDMPAFAIGRAGWDNWMFYKARYEGWKLVDATKDIRIVHQDHDYSHLPQGQPHYRLPETDENVRLAGGKRTIFNLLDADYSLEGGEIQPARVTGEKWLREMEIFPLVKLHSYTLGQLMFALFHPQKAWRELRSAMNKPREQTDA